jgi:hypothetical protein
MIFLGVVGQVEGRLSLFVDSINLVARSCIVCAERTIGSEIILGATDVSHT